MKSLASRDIEILRDESNYIDFKITSDLIELRNLALVAHLIIRERPAAQEDARPARHARL